MPNTANNMFQRDADPARSTSVVAATDSWTSLTCAACETVCRVASRELLSGETISCRNCWQPLSRHSLDAGIANSCGGTTPLDAETILDIQKVAAAKHVRQQAMQAQVAASRLRNANDSQSASEASIKPAAGCELAGAVAARIELGHVLIETGEVEAAADRWASLKRGLEKRREDFAGAIISVVVHMLLWLILAAILVKFNDPWGDSTLKFAISDQATLLESAGMAPVDQADDAQDDAPFVPLQNVRVDHLVAGGSGAAGVAATDFNLPSSLDMQAGTGEASWSIESGIGFAGRSPESRAALAAKNGGTPESEDAVERGLQWLVRTQSPDGSWDFAHQKRLGGGRVANAVGRHEPMAATGMALMCFLGAGYTHEAGKYQEEVRQGLDFLTANRKRTGDFQGSGDMYSQGLVAIALCEAYGMSGDRTLREAAQSSLTFIEAAQHPAGGWRYQPKTAGDTSVVGWQVMAIASGRMAGLETSRVVTGRAVQFLDSVFTKTTGTYGYISRTPGNAGSRTAIGTLCRMYLHFGFDPAAMQKSIAQTAKTDPVGNDLYTQYYAMQVLHHVGGPVWENWNPKCRDYLVQRQVKTADESGSWAPLSNWASSGGRHYETCLSIMCLEVYYRHLPIYKDAAFQ